MNNGAGAVLPEVRPASPLDYVRRNLSDPALTTATIARATGLSPRGVQKSFARQINQTPTAYISEQRLARAATLLSAAGKRSVTDVAYEVGFNDSAFFTRCFRSRYGMTPRDWRARGSTAG